MKRRKKSRRKTKKRKRKRKRKTRKKRKIRTRKKQSSFFSSFICQMVLTSKNSSLPIGGGLDQLLSRLTTCVNRDLIDQAAVDFCYVNSKANRKKLVKALFNVPRTQLALLPYYARLGFYLRFKLFKNSLSPYVS